MAWARTRCRPFARSSGSVAFRSCSTPATATYSYVFPRYSSSRSPQTPIFSSPLCRISLTISASMLTACTPRNASDDFQALLILRTLLHHRATILSLRWNEEIHERRAQLTESAPGSLLPLEHELGNDDLTGK